MFRRLFTSQIKRRSDQVIQDNAPVIKKKSRWFLKGLATMSALAVTTASGTMLYHGINPIDSTIRFCRSFSAGARAVAIYKYNEWSIGEKNPNFDRLMEETHSRIADIILDLCLKQEGLYIKSGQHMASQDNSLPKAYRKLAILQDSVTFKDFSMVEDTFIEEYGMSPFDMFESVERTPIAAASIGQVHRAVTKEGDQVVIKVQYPEISKRFVCDMLTYKSLFYVAEFLLKNSNLVWIANEIEGFLKKELDFENEGRNAQRARDDLKGNDDYYVPTVYWDFTSKRIITLEYIDGVKVNDVEGIKKLGLTNYDVSYKTLSCLAEQIFVHGFFHGDPHPGNVFVRKHPKKIGECQVVLLDHGLYKEMDHDARIRCCKLYRDLILQDYDSFDETSKSIGISDWKKLAFLILLRPVDNSMFEKHFPGMSIKEIGTFMKENRALFAKKMELMMQEEMEGWSELMSNLPKEFIILLRNSNLARSINAQLGAPVNRFVIYVRHSFLGLDVENREPFFKRLWDRIRFEFRVQVYELLYLFEMLAIRTMIYFGKLPPNVNQESLADIESFEDLPFNQD